MCGAVILVVAALTPYAPASNRLTDLLSHFPVYYLAAAFCGIIIAIAARAPRKIIRLLIAALALNIATIWPYIPVSSAKPAAGKTIKILQVNTLFINKDTTALAALIAQEKPDIIAAAEVNSAFATLFATLADEYPHRFISAADHHAYGLALLSRFPAAQMAREYLGDANIPSLTATLDIEGRQVHLANIHPRTPLRFLAERDAVFDAVSQKYKSARAKNENLIVLGDFNATPWCPAIKKLVKELDLNHARAGFGITPTWPQWLPAPLRLPIDHVLMGGDFETAHFSIAPPVGSDHLATITIITLP